MTTMFRTSRYNSKIEAREVVKATDKSVMFQTHWGNGSRQDRENRISDSHRWFDTWEDAHAYLLDRAENEVVSARLRLERAKGELGNVKGMKKPEPAVE